MDSKVGDEEELVSDQLAYIRNYNHSKEAKSQGQQVSAMHRRFSKVHSHLKKVCRDTQPEDVYVEAPYDLLVEVRGL